jgi:anti-sigma regulatory factor (Ser/Thr protein kinase)
VSGEGDTQSTTHDDHRWFDGTTSSIRAARQFALQLLPRGLRQAGDVALLVSELATNAVVHARSHYRVSVRVESATIVVGVTDHSPVMPIRRSVDPTSADGGRGLVLVESLASRWGVEPIAGNGKTTWFEIDQRSPN